MDWYRKKVSEVLKELEVDFHRGLSHEEINNRLEKYGRNEIIKAPRKTPIGMLLDQFKDFMIMVLIVAAVISGLIGDLKDTIAIIAIVIINAVVGFIQEYRAEKAIEALKAITAPRGTVLRNEARESVPASLLVPGDIVFLEAGNIVPADLRLIESATLRIEEASLTGESVPAEKHTEIIKETHIPVGDIKNMAFSSTIVTYGRGLGVVVETGMSTEIGKIASMLEKQEEVKTPLQKRMAKFGQRLAIAALVICSIVFLIGILRGEPVILMLLTSISLAVAAIPEALPAVITISLALGAKKMIERHVLLRRLPAVETLGSVTYICSDKTGTLTQNKMTVEEAYVDVLRLYVRGRDYLPKGDFPHLTLFLKGITLCNDATLSEMPDEKGNCEVFGDPTEAALLVFSAKSGINRKSLMEKYRRVSEFPFDSGRKKMTTINKNPEGGYISFTKGALEVLLDGMRYYHGRDGIKPMTPEKRNEIIEISKAMARDGLRVLAIGCRFFEHMPEPEVVEADLMFLGLAGIMDPPREEVVEAISLCKSAGIRPVMITGDHPETARVIAKRLGIIDDIGGLMTGRELSTIPLEVFEEKVKEIGVYARVAPEHKIKIVRGLQDKGEIVAMTGDGVNDAPALKGADIGVAMGITGTDVAKEASDMILADDNFASIVAAVREGRRIYDNIRKFIKYLATSNSAEIWTILFAPFFGLPIPLLPLHILWINLVTDSLPALALSLEPEERGTMKRPPRNPKESVFAHGMWQHIIWVGILMAGVSLGVMYWAYHTGHAHWQTMIFTVLCLSQLGHVLAIRTEKDSFFTIGPLSNKSLLGAVILTVLLQLLVIYIPVFQEIFKTQALSPAELALSLGLSTVIFFAVEVEKYVKRRWD